MGPGETIALIAVLLAAVKIIGPVGAAIGDRLRGGRLESQPDHRLADEVDGLRERVQHLEQMQQRVMELEERVDFAERLLARPPGHAARIGDPAEEGGR